MLQTGCEIKGYVVDIKLYADGLGAHMLAKGRYC